MYNFSKTERLILGPLNQSRFQKYMIENALIIRFGVLVMEKNSLYLFVKELFSG